MSEYLLAEFLFVMLSDDEFIEIFGDPEVPHFSSEVYTSEMKLLETEIRQMFANDEDAFTFTMLYLAASLGGTKK